MSLRPSEIDCKFHIVVGSGQNAPLIDSEPLSPALLEGRVLAKGSAIICFSNVEPYRPDEVKNDPLMPPVQLITGVSLACVARTGGVWGKVFPLMDTPETWAGWIKGLEPHPDDADALLLTYARDYTFNFL